MPKRDSFFVPKKKVRKEVSEEEKETSVEPISDDVNVSSVESESLSSGLKSSSLPRKGFSELLSSSEEKPSSVPADESAEERRVRLAREYLSSVKEDLGEDATAEDIQAVLSADTERAKKAFRFICAKIAPIVHDDEIPVVRRAQRLPITCVCVDDAGDFAYVGSKDGTVMQFSLSESISHVATFAANQRKTGRGKSHTACVNGISVSSDGSVLAVASEDKTVHLWDTKTHEEKPALSGHRDSVTCVAFRPGTQELFSGSRDRTVKVWNASSGAYIETLFGHQGPVSAVVSGERERAVSVGYDGTCRLWKVAEETQLVYRAPRGPLDCVAVISETLWISGSGDGSIALWSAAKKAPVDFREKVHSGKAITAVGACRRTDLIATGSSDGFVRLWSLEKSEVNGLPKLVSQQTIPVRGFVNGIGFSGEGDWMVVGVGREHRMGRWEVDKEAKNGVLFFKLDITDNEEDDN